MQEFAVVLIWDTMSDEGDVPILVKIADSNFNYEAFMSLTGFND